MLKIGTSPRVTATFISPISNGLFIINSILLPDFPRNNFTRESVSSFPKDILLTADTVAYCGRRLIDKTLKIDIAKIHLGLLSGRRHRVSTSVCIKDERGNIVQRTVTTSVSFKKQKGLLGFHIIRGIALRSGIVVSKTKLY